MNKHILIAMDWKNRSEEELIENYHDAAYYDAVYNVASYAVIAHAEEALEEWLNQYFKITGENVPHRAEKDFRFELNVVGSGNDFWMFKAVANGEVLNCFLSNSHFFFGLECWGVAPGASTGGFELRFSFFSCCQKVLQV